MSAIITPGNLKTSSYKVTSGKVNLDGVQPVQITIDKEVSETSENPVQNKAIFSAIQTAVRNVENIMAVQHNSLNARITNETDRAQAVENSLTSEISRINQINNEQTANILSETVRAEREEQTIARNLETETNRATEVESTLSGMIEDEISRAILVETELSTKVDNMENNKPVELDYTAFEVFPTTEDIPAGTVSDVEFGGKIWNSSIIIKNEVVYHEASNTVYKCLQECTGIEPNVTDGWQSYYNVHDGFEGKFYKYIEKITANNTAYIQFYSNKIKEENDIVIDWGDNTTSIVKSDSTITDYTLYGSASKTYRFSIKHTYSNENCNKKHIVKVYGKDYFMIRCGTDPSGNNIVSRFLDVDLPIASCVVNVSSFCKKSNRILQTISPGAIINIENFSNCFAACKNLRYVYLNNSTFSASAKEWLFSDCPNLECDINNFNTIIQPGCINGDQRSIFGSIKLYGTVDPYVYWKNDKLNPLNPIYPPCIFTKAAEDLIKQVPIDYSAYPRTSAKYMLDTWNFCEYEGKYYKCKIRNNDKIPTVTANWEKYWEEVKNPWLSYSYVYSNGDIYKSQFGNLTKITDLNNEYIHEIKADDYTAFEVFPTNTIISAGTKDNFDELNAIFKWNSNEIAYIQKNIEFSNLPYNYQVEANSELFLEFYIKDLKNDVDIIIDWGDGNIEKVIDNHTHPDDDIEVINISHIYTSFKPTIVKIYGSDYYMVRNSSNYDSSKKSIIRNIFSNKYPCSSNLIYASVICKCSDHLLKLEVPVYITQQLRVLCNAFQECRNLNTAMFSYMPDSIEIQTIFYKCHSLTNTNIKFPSIVNRNNGFKRFFSGCNNLAIDILDVFPENGFSMSNLDFSSTFRDCANLTCSDYDKLGNLLWNDNSKNFTPNTCFTGCSTEFKSHVPTSWGGTNKELEFQLQLKKLNVDTSNYTAFEVYPTDKDFNAGDKSIFEFGGPTWSAGSSYITGDVVYHSASDVVYKCLKDCIDIEPNMTDGWSDYWKVHVDFTNKYYNYIRPTAANAICKITYYELSKSQLDSDMIVDWGDGTISRVSDNTDTNITYSYYGDSYGYSGGTLTHTYLNPDNITTYTVKIYGTKYFMLRTGSGTENDSIISKVFDSNLPTASNLVNVSSLCRNSNRLFEVKIPYGYKMHPVNLANLFNSCRNLRYVSISNGIFLNKLHSVQYLFGSCSNLECNINNFNALFINGTEESDYTNMFVYDHKLYGIINPNVFWANSNMDVRMFRTYPNAMFYLVNLNKDIYNRIPLDWKARNRNLGNYSIIAGEYALLGTKYYRCLKNNSDKGPEDTYESKGIQLPYWEEVVDPYLSYKLVELNGVNYRIYENGLMISDSQISTSWGGTKSS